MIIVKIVGGLASQMHKYALGRVLSLKHDVELKLDLTWFDNTGIDSKWEYQLDKVFNIKAQKATQEEISKFKKTRGFRYFINRITNKFLKKKFFCRKHINKSFMSVEDFQELGPDIYLDGEWVGFSYFHQIENKIKKDFSFYTKINHNAENILKSIEEKESVFIHIRRGDYISNQHAAKFHEVMDMKYYNDAVSYILNKVDNPNFFIFSDDISWAKKNFTNLSNTTFVEGNSNDEDLLLMSKCKHSIIGNSGFSYTASWLNDYVDKIVIAPSKWIKDININNIIIESLQKDKIVIISS